MKLLAFFRRKPEEIESDTLADFLLRAPEHKKKEVFREAAQRANEEQRKIFEQSRLEIETF